MEIEIGKGYRDVSHNAEGVAVEWPEEWGCQPTEMDPRVALIFDGYEKPVKCFLYNVRAISPTIHGNGNYHLSVIARHAGRIADALEKES